MILLSEKYKYDGKPILNLTKLQLKNKERVEEKIDSDEYTFEKINCAICEGSDFELLAEKDRYGLYVSTVICRKCGLLQTNPRMTQESYNKFYDSLYRKLYGESDSLDIFFNNQMLHGKEILEYVETKTHKEFKNKLVVEIGAGAGGILQAFKNKNNKVFGLDLGSEYIKFGVGKGLNLKVGTIKELKELNEKPDLVIYSHVIEHILDPYKELKELRKYLKKDSIVYIEVPGVKNLNRSYNQDFLRYLQNAHVYHFSLKTLTNIAKKAGLDLVYGSNEWIISIFKLGNSNNNYQNDYKESNQYLMNLETKRKNPFNFFRMRNWIFHSLVISFTKKTGTYKIARKIYQSIRYK